MRKKSIQSNLQIAKDPSQKMRWVFAIIISLPYALPITELQKNCCVDFYYINHLIRRVKES